MPLPTWQDDDIRDDLRGRRVAVVGYGAQGRAQALNLSDAGARVVVGLREGSASQTRARADGLAVAPMSQAVSDAEIVAMLIPDEHHGIAYRELVEPHVGKGACLVLAHGFSVHYELFRPRPDLDMVLVAPKGAGFQVRAAFEAGNGVPALIATAQDATGKARERALAFAKALGCGRAGVMETRFADETETDLFGEQAVLCGGVPALVREAFETLVEAGYPEELAYFECLHELKLTCDLLHSRGIAGMSKAISNTAEYGALVAGPEIVDGYVRRRMREALERIRKGEFARHFMEEAEAGTPNLRRARARASEHRIETVGQRIRAMMPWLRD